MSEEKKLSPLEATKSGSNYLRGTIAEELGSEEHSFNKDNANLLKHHGTYQQDDRDTRGAKDGGGKSLKNYSFMVRTKIPGGRMTSEQLLAELDLCDEVGNTTLRITTRQGLQLHGVLKENLWAAIHRINQVQMTTLAACGDVGRNVMCCPAPHRKSAVHQQIEQLSTEMAAMLAPQSRAYFETWIRDPDDGQRQLVGASNGSPNGHAAEDVEPLYGPTYLPRKFKVAFGLPDDNCVDLYANDLAFMAICENDNVIGYNVLVGGGFGVTPSAAKTFPAVAKRMAFVPPTEVIAVTTAIIKVQRDFGNRSDRKLARMKYLIANWGLEKFKSKVEEYYGQPLAEPHHDDVRGFDDHLGWHEQGDGHLFYGLNIENGRIHDLPSMQLKSALREICGKFKPGIRLTAHQSLIFTDIHAGDREAIEEILHRHAVKLSSEISNVRRWSMACVAWPTCGLSITEAERELPGLIDQLEVELAKLGLSKETFTLRMTGCPNGCARPYNSDIGLVGKAAGKYTILVGGRLLGDRLNFIYKDMILAEDVVPTIVPLLAFFKQDRQLGETLGDFCHRRGVAELLAFADQMSAGAV